MNKYHLHHYFFGSSKYLNLLTYSSHLYTYADNFKMKGLITPRVETFSVWRTIYKVFERQLHLRFGNILIDLVPVALYTFSKQL